MDISLGFITLSLPTQWVGWGRGGGGGCYRVGIKGNSVHYLLYNHSHAQALSFCHFARHTGTNIVSLLCVLFR